MKLQCSCGAKYAFDAKPEMVDQPVKFICPNCGLDASDFVNQLIRQEFDAATSAPAGSAPAPSLPPPPPSAGQLRVSVESPVVPKAVPVCAKHGEPATEKCAVCHKPICPKCLEVLGYFCSPLCKGKAEAKRLNVPAYAGGRDVAEAKFWQKTGLIAGILGVLVVLFFGAWIWYAWFGSVPHPYFSKRFEDADRGYYGRAQLVGQDDLVALHGGTLARYDLKGKRTVWSAELINQSQVERGLKEANDEQAKANEGFGLHSHRSPDEIERSVRQALQSELALHVAGHNVWVAQAGKLIHYDWDSGQVARTVDLPERGGDLVEGGDELQMIGLTSVTHISLASGEVRVEQLTPAGTKTVVLAQTEAGGGLPGTTGGGQPLDPQKVESQAQNLNLQGRLALPALLSNAHHEQQLEQALRDDPQHPRNDAKSLPDHAELFRLVAGPTGVVRFSCRLLEEHMVTHSAMKAPSGKSVLNGDLTSAKTTAVANEILNGMQRDAGGDTVTVDESRYQVTVHLPDAASTPDWTGEVTGPPQLFVFKTVNVVAAGKDVVVLDKSNKKLWQASLTYPLPGSEAGLAALVHEASPYGEGPCVERGDTLYVFDQALLTAFDLSSGNARWRLPSVGVVGLFFDQQDNLYVNTTTGNPDDVRYSRQIDVTRKTEAVVSKIDAKTGKTLWSIKPGGFVSYAAGNFIYVIEAYDPNPTDEDVLNDMTASLQKPAYMRLTRLRPSDGRVLWEYYDARCPVNWSFENNSIQLIFKREVQVLRYVTL
jgi:outer membrane protein assembly factor BamB